ncbi:MAG: family 14 glycosylhydrolase [Lentisphaerota bacterium]
MFNKLFKRLTTALLLFVSITIFAASSDTFNVMAPLALPAWLYSIRTNQDYINGGTLTPANKAAYQQQINAFQGQIAAAKAAGTDAVSVDVWWGMVEGQGDQEFVWNDYQNVFSMISSAGLKIQAIMSFHQCGGNVGDDVNIPLPSWIWSLTGNGGKYISEQLYTNGAGTAYPLNPTIPSHTVNTVLTPAQESAYGNPEIVSMWASNDSGIHEQYQEFIESFVTFVNNNGFAGDIQAINISCGPAGECRFPSYDSYSATVSGKTYNIGYGWPSRGFLQCYSANAISAFQNAMQTKYGTIAALNKAWATSLSSFSAVTPPTNGDAFFSYAVQTPRPQYAQDFINWYNQSLIEHGKEMITDALVAMGNSSGAMKNAVVEIKIPGISWQMGSTTIPRSAEICAGLIPSTFQSDVYDYGCGPSPFSNANCGNDYSGIMQMVYNMNTDPNNTTNHLVQLYFTCLEQSNDDVSSQGYSWSATLVYCVGQQAHQIGLIIKGENALAPNTGWSWSGSPLQGTPLKNATYGGGQWANICYAMTNSYYEGITILRVADLTTNGQGMYGNYYGLIVNFNKGNPGVPTSCPQISNYNVNGN